MKPEIALHKQRPGSSNQIHKQASDARRRPLCGETTFRTTTFWAAFIGLGLVGAYYSLQWPTDVPFLTIASWRAGNRGTSAARVKGRCRSEGPVVQGSPGFPSYCDFEGSVSYDARSILLDGQRSLLLSGSIHGPRSTPGTWGPALDLAVQQGLNMMEVYVFWNVHAPISNTTLVFNGSANLGLLVDMCAERGLFVTLRIGPYVCAEWDYGGLPIWLGVTYPDIVFRSSDQRWLEAMSSFSEAIADYVRSKGLWAGQGGPIVMAQIENELDGADDYVTWCGELAAQLESSVVWLMCNGDSANNTVNTCNGEDCVSFLESHGQNGRILVDQPALWTENEGGFQLWGDAPNNPSDYFWGRTAASLAYATLRWIARGGSHVNYYMWWGGSNRGNFAGAGLANAYAYDVVLCPDGQKHQPKFDHLAAMHMALRAKATALLAKVPEPKSMGNGMLAFEFSDDCIMIESGAVTLNATLKLTEACTISPSAYAVAVVDPVSCTVIYDSATVAESSQSYRRVDSLMLDLRNWTHFDEIAALGDLGESGWTPGIVEQSQLTVATPWTQYAWYEATMLEHVAGSRLTIESDHANAWLIFVDGVYKGEAFDTTHNAEGPLNYTIHFDITLTNGSQLQLLSESLGFSNLINRWDGKSTPKFKGVVGRVLIDDREPNAAWRSRPGLAGPATTHEVGTTLPATWSTASFTLEDFPAEDNATLHLDAASLGRGHLYVNGYDAGRFWNITRGSSDSPTQRYYHIPPDWLYTDGPNKLLIFDALGGDPAQVSLVTTRLVPTDSPQMPDQIDSKLSCLI